MKTTFTRILIAIAVAIGATSQYAAQQMPRDRRPGDPRPATQREIELQKATAMSPNDVNGWLALAKLQEGRGASTDAVATLTTARTANPSDVSIYSALARLYLGLGQFDKTIETLEAAAALQPANPAGYHVIGTFYFEKSRDQSIAADERRTYIQRGIVAEDRALGLNADYMEALVYKNLLLRTQATLETDAAKQAALLQEADSLRNRALQLQKQVPASTASGGAVPPPPPPPPPPPAPKKGGGSVQLTPDR